MARRVNTGVPEPGQPRPCAGRPGSLTPQAAWDEGLDRLTGQFRVLVAELMSAQHGARAA
jgi:hypothetical protein